MKKSLFATPYMVWVVLFTVIPLSMLLYYGFTIPVDGGKSFSLDNLLKVFEPIYLKAFWRSIRLAGLSTMICLILAYPLAYILSKGSNQNNTVLFIFILPMWMNFLLRTYAWLSLLETNNGFLNTVLRFIGLPTINIINTPTAIVLGMVYNFLPFMVLPIYNVLIKIDASLVEASGDLGANPRSTFMKVVFPLTLPGVMSGISMVFMPAVTTFVIPNLLGGGKINLIGNIIEQQFLTSYNWYFSSSLSIVLMVIILISMAIISKFDDEKRGVGLW